MEGCRIWLWSVVVLFLAPGSQKVSLSLSAPALVDRSWGMVWVEGCRIRLR